LFIALDDYITTRVYSQTSNHNFFQKSLQGDSQA